MRSLLSVSLFFILIYCARAQEQALEKVLPFNNSKLEVIKEGRSVTGYYFFYQLDKKDTKDNLYLLNTYDERLNEIHSRGLKFPVKQRLIRVAHNGKGFCLQVFDPSAAQYEYVFLDADLKESGKLSQKVPKDIAYNVALQQRYHSMIALPGKGFAIYGVYPQSKKWEIHAYNLQGVEIWKQASGNTDKWPTETIMPIDGVTGHVVLYETHTKYEKKKNVSRSFLRLLDGQTGQEVFKTQLVLQQSPAFYSIFETGTGYLLAGNYTDKKNPALQGEALLLFGSEGKIEAERYLSFADETLKMREGQENRRTFQGKTIRIREVKSIDHTYFMIVDLFEKKEHFMTGADPVNMAVFEFEKDLALKDFYLLESTGSPATKNRFLYTVQEEKENSFKLVFDRELDPNSDNIIIGTSTYHRNKIKPGDVKMFLRSPKYKILPAVPGKIVIFDYFEKEKTVNLRLEKF